MLLRRPLWLFVTIAAYMCHGNPADLIELDGDTVQNHLLARLIPETIAQHQPQKGKPWSTTETHQYLKAIAGLLARRRTQNQGSFTGVRVHELWQLAGRRLPKAFTATLNGSLVTLLMLMGLAWYHEKTSYWIPPHAAGDILIIAGLTYAVWVFIASYRTPGYLRSLDFLTLMAKNNRQRLLLAFLLPLAGLVVGLFYGLWFSQEYGDRIGYSYGISWTILFFVLSAEILLGQLPEAVRRPSSIMRRALTFQSAMIATYGLSFAAAHGVANKFAYPSHPTAFTDGAVLGLCIGLAIGVGRTYRAPGTRHLIAITFLTVTGTLPRRRMGKFLDWAYTAGILRFVGISVQFRHQAVQH